MMRNEFSPLTLFTFYIYKIYAKDYNNLITILDISDRFS